MSDLAALWDAFLEMWKDLLTRRRDRMKKADLGDAFATSMKLPGTSG